MLPSTFCITWWMWPFRTVTEPKRLRCSSARPASSVVQPHCGYTAHSGTCAHTTTGVLLHSGHRGRALGFEPLEDLGDGVEGAGLLAVRLVAGVEHERRSGLECVDPVHDLLQRCGRVAVGLALEADVRVADLGEAEALGPGLGGRRRRHHARRQDPAAGG